MPNMTGSIQIQPLDARPGGEWEQRLSACADATVFHSAAWLRVLQRTYGYTLYYLFAEPDFLFPIAEIRSRLTGVRGVCLPFTDLCAPLGKSASDREAIRSALLAFGRSRGWSHVELRGDGDAAGEDPSITYTAHRLDLRPGAARLRESFASSARRAWSKAERLGVRVEFSHSPEALRTFCQLHAMTRQRHGAPPQPPEFFHRLHEELLQKNQGFIAIGTAGSLPLSASVFLHHGKKAVYKFGASDAAYHKMRGNLAVMGQALLELAERGFDEVHFGRTSSDNDGLRRYKLLWGGTEEPLPYWRWSVETGRSLPVPDRTEGLHTTLFRRLPAQMNRWAGQILYPHLD